MRKYLAIFVLVLAFSAAASGEVFYEIDSGQDQVYMNTTIKLECTSNCPVNRWSLSWTKPPNSEILWINDSLGRIEDYEVQGEKILLTTNTGEKRNEEYVKIAFRIDESAEEIHDGLYKRKLSLPGFSGERTAGTVETENLVSGWTSFGFQTSYAENGMNFSGEGPLILRTKFGEGFETEYFEFFGDSREDVRLAYEIPVGTLGFYQQFEKFPVAVLPGEKYNRTVNRWSAGEYVGGVIRIREGLGEDFKPVLAHEVVHGLNDRELNWDSTSSSYFDEGTGKYVEFMVKKKLGHRTANLFGEPVTYTERKGSTLYQYTIPSKGDREDLWNYYQNDQEFMKTWNANMESVRGFGYAYSELVIRNYIARQNGSLRQLYRDLEVRNEIKDPEVKWSIYSDHMDMTPCKYDSRSRFEACLETINEYDYPVYSARPNRSKTSLAIERLEVPKREPGSDLVGETSSIFQALVDGLIELLRSLGVSV